MKDNRTPIVLVALALLFLSSLVLWPVGLTAAQVVRAAFAPFNTPLVRAGHEPLGIVDLAIARKVNGQMYPKWILRATGQPCGTNCKVWLDLKAAKVGRADLPLPWVAGTGGVLFVASVLFGVVIRSPNPRRSLINHRRDRIRLRTQGDTLPIIQQGGTQWGIMGRPHLQGVGRREPGNGLFVGAPGSGKSSIIKYWLVTSDLLNFVVVDPKGELWRQSAGHRATLGRVVRLDLTSMTGDAYDPFATDDANKVLQLLTIVIPDGDTGSSKFFADTARNLALAFWSAARANHRPAMPVLAQAASAPLEEMLALANSLIASASASKQAALTRRFRAIFAKVWEDVENLNNEKQGIISSFNAAFGKMITPEILSTMVGRTFSPVLLAQERATLYITAHAENEGSPHRLPIELLVGAILDEIIEYVDEVGVKEEIVIIADEAGLVKIPNFNKIAASGRSRGITLTAFIQDVGQLRLYHLQGWKGITGTLHHWTFWKTKTPDELHYLRDICGVYDKPSESRDPEERKRRPYTEVRAFDDMGRWGEDEVLSIFEYDERYVVKGKFVTPYASRVLKARLQIPPPKWPTLPRPLPVPPTEVQQPALVKPGTPLPPPAPPSAASASSTTTSGQGSRAIPRKRPPPPPQFDDEDENF